MALRIEGRVVQITPIETGQGQRGEWKKRFLVIETLDQFPKKIAFVTWNEKAEALNNLSFGTRVSVDFTIESRQFNNKWYTDARLFGVKVIKEEEVVPKGNNRMPDQSVTAPQTPSDYSTQTSEDENNAWFKEDKELDDRLDGELNNIDDLNDGLDIDNEDDALLEDDPEDDLPF